MKSSKNDRRSKYTQMVIMEGLLMLLQQQPLSKITVAELCSTADVNRGTFYTHFYDIFDVYESIEKGFFEELKTKLANTKLYEVDSYFFKEIMLLIYKNIELVRIILQNINGSDFLRRVIVFVRNKFIDEWREKHNKLPTILLEQIFSYSANGAIGLISDWVQTGMTQPLDEISELIGKLNEIIINAYINKE